MIGEEEINGGFECRLNLKSLTTRPIPPEIQGGNETLATRGEKTISIKIAGEDASGVKNYEYYKSTSNITPTDETEATGETSGEVTINEEGTTYIWYRTVSNNGYKSAWSNKETVIIDTTTNYNKYEVKNLTSTGYDIYVYGITSSRGVKNVIFPTWTEYGGQDDIMGPWNTNSSNFGTNLGNGNWKYHVDISNHNNESGKYITDCYVQGNDNAFQFIFSLSPRPFVQTSDYVGSIYLDSQFFVDHGETLSDKTISSNFTYEFDANIHKEIPISEVGRFITPGLDYNFIISEGGTVSNESAAIGLAMGSNGVMAIARTYNYYYVLLSYTTDLTKSHRYRFTIKDTPYLYMDGKLVSTGISPISPVTTLVTDGIVGQGAYEYLFNGFVSEIILYNSVR